MASSASLLSDSAASGQVGRSGRRSIVASIFGYERLLAPLSSSDMKPTYETPHTERIRLLPRMIRVMMGVLLVLLTLFAVAASLAALKLRPLVERIRAEHQPPKAEIVSLPRPDSLLTQAGLESEEMRLPGRSQELASLRVKGLMEARRWREGLLALDDLRLRRGSLSDEQTLWEAEALVAMGDLNGATQILDRLLSEAAPGVIRDKAFQLFVRLDWGQRTAVKKP